MGFKNKKWLRHFLFWYNDKRKAAPSAAFLLSLMM
jgi:hypothetical protein